MITVQSRGHPSIRKHGTSWDASLTRIRRRSTDRCVADSGPTTREILTTATATAIALEYCRAKSRSGLLVAKTNLSVNDLD
jgi:hypothetical protein